MYTQNNNALDMGGQVLSSALEIFAVGIDLEDEREKLNLLIVQKGLTIENGLQLFYGDPDVKEQADKVEELADRFAVLENEHTEKAREYQEAKDKGEVCITTPFLHVIEGGGSDS